MILMMRHIPNGREHRQQRKREYRTFTPFQLHLIANAHTHPIRAGTYSMPSFFAGIVVARIVVCPARMPWYVESARLCGSRSILRDKRTQEDIYI